MFWVIRHEFASICPVESLHEHSTSVNAESMEKLNRVMNVLLCRFQLQFILIMELPRKILCKPLIWYITLNTESYAILAGIGNDPVWGLELQHIL